MATAIVDVVNQEGFSLPIHVLLDSASDANLVTDICNKLNLNRNMMSEIVSGINGTETQICQFTNIIIKFT